MDVGRSPSNTNLLDTSTWSRLPQIPSPRRGFTCTSNQLITFGIVVLLVGCGIIVSFLAYTKYNGVVEDNQQLVMEFAKEREPRASAEALTSTNDTINNQGARPNSGKPQTHLTPTSIVNSAYHGKENVTITYSCFFYCQHPTIFLSRLTINATDLTNGTGTWTGRASAKKKAKQSAAYKFLQEVRASDAQRVPADFIPEVYDRLCQKGEKKEEYDRC